MKPTAPLTRQAGARMVIQAKLMPPPEPQGAVVRHRVTGRLGTLMDRDRVVLISAAAGAGKTTAVAQTTKQLERTLAWLTVDQTDAAPGRLVTYIEAALTRVLPDLDRIATKALAAGIPHAEAVGLLAESIGGRDILIVIDELERLGEAEAAWEVIDALVRYAPPATRMAMISRREPPAGLLGPAGPGSPARLGSEDLAFTIEEAARALEARGISGVDPATAIEATGGWVTGVLFEAWRAREHRDGAGGNADPLHGYLSAHILGQLQPDDREFLITTSILDEVTAARAEGLAVPDAGRRLASLRAAHLPVTWTDHGSALRAHSRFREYLLACLERRGERELRALQAAYGRVLAREGRHEDATEQLLSAGALEEALPSAQAAIIDVIERLDTPIAECWLETLAPVAPRDASELTTAELMLAVGNDDFRRAMRIADQLATLGERDTVARSSDRAAGLMAWCYGHAGRPDDAETVIAVARPSPMIDAMRYGLGLLTGDRPPDPPEARAGPLDAVVLSCYYGYGRLKELGEVQDSKWVDAMSAPWRIDALRAIGHTEQALTLYQEASARAKQARVGLEAMVGPEVLIDAALEREARQAVERGRRLARASGSIQFQLQNRIIDAKLALRLERDLGRARKVLTELDQEPALERAAYLSEWVDTWYGLLLLLDGDDQAAARRLGTAVEGMIRGEHLLELPTAAVYLAEAHWRMGDEALADGAADLALEAARRQGSNHVLLQALADFPAVASRRIDAEPDPDSRWHELGRALLAKGTSLTTTVNASVGLREFGRRALIVNAVEVRPRLAKCYELLAYLLTRPGLAADREELLDVLFDGRAEDSTRAYLRQVVHELRVSLPDEIVINVERGRVRLEGEVSVISESGSFESRLVEAASLQGDERLAALVGALRAFDQGEYLPGAQSGWIDERRQQLADLATSARYEAAELAFAHGSYRDAQRLAHQVIRADGFREGAWRLQMRIANAMGNEDGVISAYRLCERALAQLDTSPSSETRKLLELLRR